MLRLTEEENWRCHIAEEQTFICEECKAILGDEFDLKYHKDKYHESSLKPPAAECSCGDCDPEEVFPCG